MFPICGTFSTSKTGRFSTAKTEMIRIGHGMRAVSGFVMVLGYSRAIAALFTLDQKITLVQGVQESAR